MLNQSVVVGRLIEDPVNEGDKKLFIKVAVPRSYKNMNGEYDTDFITCTLWNGIAENIVDYVKKGDLLGIKGRLQSGDDDKLILVAEKVTFLSSPKE